MPQRLTRGIAALSGEDLSDVQVHRNSSRPAQLDAEAYAQGRGIHLAPGQERHLPHEAWHIVQQRQGRVRPTGQVGGQALNDDPHLEREADTMGQRALAAGDGARSTARRSADPRSSQEVQRKVSECRHDAGGPTSEEPRVIQRVVVHDGKREAEKLPAYYSTLDSPSKRRYFDTREQAEILDRELQGHVGTSGSNDNSGKQEEKAAHGSADISDLFGPPTEEDKIWDELAKKHQERQEAIRLFGPEKESDQFWTDLGDNFEHNVKEKQEKGVAFIGGDPDLAKLYRTRIQPNPAYGALELTVRATPLTIEWTPDSTFGTSPSRAHFDGASNTIRVGSSLKGKPEEIVEAISFELQNAGKRKDFFAVHARYEHDVKHGASGYQGIPLFNPQSQVNPHVALANAKRIVEMERIEYQNVIQTEKAARLEGRTSSFSALLSSGASSPWASFAKYLKTQCASGHYLPHDPDVQSPTWNGWRFVTEEERKDKDPLA
jgi:hypothetical protein